MIATKRARIGRVALAAWLACCGALCGVAGGEEYHHLERKRKSREMGSLLDRPDVAAWAGHIHECQRRGDGGIRIQLMVRELTPGKRDGTALAIVDRLLARGDIAGDTGAADVLLKLVTTRRDRDMRAFPEAFAKRAARLLGHDDPVIQAMAEWTLTLRVHKEMASTPSRRKCVWPREDNPGWYQAWWARPASLRLRDDYARQLVQLGRHRRCEDVLADAAVQRERAEKLLARNAALHDVPEAPALLRRVDAAFAEVRAAAEAGDLTSARAAWLKLRAACRPIMLTVPEFPREGIAFITRDDYGGNGGGNINGAVKPNRQKPGGDVMVKRTPDPAEAATPLIAGRLGKGSVRGMDVWWGGDRVVFSYCKQPDGDHPYGFNSDVSHLYEMGIDGTGLTQLTDHPTQSDIECAYLPDGDVVFCSDRSNFGNQCAGAFLQDKRCCNLFRLDRDAGRVRALSNNKDFDRHPHVLASGQVVFTHWEYQERHFYELHTAWTCRPDGTGTDAFYKQHIDRPMSLRDVRQAATGEDVYTATVQGHHNYEMGPIVVFSPAAGINARSAMRLLTPGASDFEGGMGNPLEPVAPGGVPNSGGRYLNPFPLSGQCFLAAGELSGDQVDFAVYYLDVWGGRELLHRQRLWTAALPQPLTPRPVPPVLPEVEEPEAPHATTYVQNVYADMPGVRPGAIKRLRIVQRLMLPAIVSPDSNQPYDFNHLHYLPGCSTSGHFSYWLWAPSRVIGTVPVAHDGSAYFKVPASVPVFFQALDADGCEVRRMRTSVTLQPGEKRGCIGCHETRDVAPATVHAARVPSAVLAPPVTPEPPPWGDRHALEFETDIQPIFEAHCARCHSGAEPAGGHDFTARKVSGFMQSYRTLFGLKPADKTPIRDLKVHKGLHPELDVRTVLAGKPANEIIAKKMQRNEYPGMLVSISNRHDGAEITRPYQFGSTQSKLITTLLNDPGHRKRVDMPRRQWRRLVAWVDLNCLYHSTVIDKSGFDREGKGTLRRLRIELPSPWQPPTDGQCFLEDMARR